MACDFSVIWTCAICGEEVPDGAHFLFHHYADEPGRGCRCPSLVCPGCCPCQRQPEALRNGQRP